MENRQVADSGGDGDGDGGSGRVEPSGTERMIFFVRLDPAECCEVNYKELVRQRTANNGTSLVSTIPAVATSPDAPAVAVDGPAGGEPEERPAPALITPRTQRFNIIERLEKRYGGGTAVVGPPVQAVGTGASDDENAGRGDLARGDEDDLYDSEDSFIDDSELQQNIEELHSQARVKTKHSGFFVNAGDEIETIDGGHDEVVELDDVPAKKLKRPKKANGESSRAVRAFLDDWSDAASEWQPGPEVVTALDGLREAVRELTAATPFTKVFPRQLDDALRAVDKLVVDAHPNRWRVNGYFATLMTFLPFTKQYLKTNMLRLEARDGARSVREAMEDEVAIITSEIAKFAKRMETESVEAVKADLSQSRDFGLLMNHLIRTQDEWIAKENEYRSMLKTEDKKHLKEADFTPLNPRQERNRLFNRVLAVFPPGLMDIQSLRLLSKPLKTKATKKAVNNVKTQASPTAATKPSGPKKKNSLAGEPPLPTPPKRSIKPFKSRVVDDPPPFNEADFEEAS